VTTHRRYYFETERAQDHDRVLAILRHACEAYWWFNEPEVHGAEHGVLSWSVTVSARDQWWAHQRIMKLATNVFQAVGVAPSSMPEPLWEPLAPHTNRGRYRVPKDG
jgi:hypothetical protein